LAKELCSLGQSSIALIKDAAGKGLSRKRSESTLIQGEPCRLRLIIDRISQDVPFYSRVFEELPPVTGTAVVTPVLVERREKFFNNAPPPRSGRFHEPCCCLRMNASDTNANSSQSAYPLDLESIFNYVGCRHFFKHSRVEVGKPFIACTTRKKFYRRLQQDRTARHDVAET